jgi:hypothetical protein
MEAPVRHDRRVLIFWVLGNCLALGLFGFAESVVLRILGALWLAGAISLAGLMAIGGMFGVGDDE